MNTIPMSSRFTVCKEEEHICIYTISMLKKIFLKVSRLVQV